MNKSFPVACYALAILSSVVAAPRAQGAAGDAADAAPVASDSLVEVVVTAERRSESLEKTPLSIQVLQPQQLADAGVTSALQLTSLLPNAQIGNDGPQVSVYVRGVGSYTSTAGSSPAVPFYADGVYVARSQSIPSEFYDIARVELLTGPQGTLYGRNATGGAFNIITNNPVLGVEDGYADLEVGNFSDQSGEFAYNAPIGETVAVRASAQIVDKGGYTSEGYGDDVHQSARLKTLWQPNADLSLLLNTSFGHVAGKGAANVVVNKDVPGWNPWLDITAPQIQSLYRAAPLNTAFGPGTVTDGSPDDGRQELRFYNVSAELNWALAPDTTLTVEPAYRYSRIQYVANLGFTDTFGYSVGDIPSRPETSKATSVEARLSGNDPRLKYVTGVYFYNEDQFQQYTVNGGSINYPGALANFGTRSYAAFGQSSFAIVDRVRLIGGVRYTSDKRSIDGMQYYINPSLVFPGTPCFLPLISGAAKCLADAFTGEKTFTNVSWKGGFEADVLDDSLLYTTVSRGFKAGGFNAQSEAGAPGEASLYQPEVLTAFELGLKNRLLNNKLQVNMSVFYWDYKEHQEPKIAETPSGALNLIYFNAGKETIYGSNIDILARIWEGATVNLTAEYSDSKYNNFVITVPTAFVGLTECPVTVDPTNANNSNVNCSGRQVARAPKWTGGIGFSQEFSVGNGTLIANTNATAAAARWLSTEFTPTELAKPYALVNASLTYRPAHDHWSVEAFVRNLFDGKDYTFAYPNSFVEVGGQAGIYAATLGPPRTYGARVGYKF